MPSLVDTGDICCHYWQHILVSMRKDVNHLCHLCVEEWCKMQNIIYIHTGICFIKTCSLTKESGIILCWCPSNERWCYNVALTLFGWVLLKNKIEKMFLPFLWLGLYKSYFNIFLLRDHFAFETPLTHCGLVAPYGDRSGSTLAQVMACCLTAPSHLPDPMLTDHQWSPMTFILGRFHKRCLNRQWPKSV